MNEHIRDDLDRQLDQAIDALNAEHAPLVQDTDDPELVELIDTARLVRQLREPAWPDDDFPDELAANLASSVGYVDLQPGQPSVNGRLKMRRTRRMKTLLLAAASLSRAIGIAALSGMIVGFVVGGIGGRIAMRVSGYLYERQHPGTVAITQSSGQQVGDITVAGTLSLMAETTLFLGIGGGLLYLLFRPWLPGSGWLKNLATGLFFVLLLGSLQINSGNADFSRLGSPAVNVLMFGLLIFGFGFAIGPVAGWLNRLIPASLPVSSMRLRSLGSYIAVQFVGELTIVLLLLSAFVGLVTVGVSAYGVVLLPLAVLAGISLACVRLLPTTTGASVTTDLGGRPARLARWLNRRRVTLAMYVLIGALFVAGGLVTLREIYRILIEQ